LLITIFFLKKDSLRPTAQKKTDPDEKWHLLLTKRREIEISALFAHLSQWKIDAVMIKGWSIARYYPSNRGRHFDDIDITLALGQFALATSKARDFKNIQSALIDHHNELRDLDTLPWETVFARTQLVRVGDTDIRVLCPEDHLRVLCAHWLMDGGEFRHRLWDFYYLIEATRDTFDWDLCFRDVPPNRREWVECVVGLTHKYLGLNIDDLPFATRIRELPPWLVRAVEREWDDGVPQRPILTTLNKPAEFVRQFKKRIRPNPLRAVVDMEGSFYRPRLFYYRVGSFVKRFAAMIKRTGTIIFNR